MKNLSIVALVAVLIFAAPSNALAKSNLLFILDASNSMWGQVDGVAKIETAKKAFNDLVSDIPDDVNVGLAAYGHTDKTSCTDVDFLTAFVDKGNRSMLSEAITKVTPTGKTPIAYALKMLGGVVASKHKDEDNNIVLLSDGIETCEGDPCAVAEKLAAQNIKTKIHVVGFDVDEATKKQLKCIADKGNGKYFNADDADSLKLAFNEVTEEVKKTAFVKPAEPVATESFRDDFDGKELADHWEIMNPDTESFIVEDGKLMIITNDNVRLSSGTLPNIFKLNKDLPEGDWEAEIGLVLEAATGAEQFELIAYSEPDRFISTRFVAKADEFYGHRLYVQGFKQAGTETNQAEKKLVSITCNVCNAEWDTWNKFYNKKLKDRKLVIKLRKIGRDYLAAAEINEPGMEDYAKKALEGFKSLRSFDNLAIAFSHSENVTAESTVYIDYIKISTLSTAEAKALAAEGKE